MRYCEKGRHLIDDSNNLMPAHCLECGATGDCRCAEEHYRDYVGEFNDDS